MFPTRYGPATRRPGLKFVAEVKDSSKKTRLIPFKFSTIQAYILEYGDEYIRFYKDRGQIIDGVGTEDLSGVDGGALIAHWLLNDDDTDAVVLDDDGGTHNGTATTNTEVLHSDGKVGSGSFDFDGQFAVAMADSDDFSFDDSGSNPFSIACWAFVTQQSDLQVLISKWKESTAREWRLSLTNDRKLQLHLSDDSIDVTGTISHWKLNETAAATSVVDAEGLQNGVSTTTTDNLTAAGATVNTGTSFNMDDQFAVEVNDNAAYSFGDGDDDSAFSIAAWVFVTASGDTQSILSKWDSTTGSADREWRLEINNDEELQFVIRDEDASASRGKSSSVLSTGWHFVVATYDGRGGTNASAGVNIYVDGVLDNAGGVTGGTYDSMVAGATKVVIGARYNTSGNLDDFFKDKIDNVAIFSEELTQASVTNMWNSGDGTETFSVTFPNAIADDILSLGWHFLCATYDSTGGATAANGIILYVDGVAVDSTKTNEDNYVAMENTVTTPKIGCQESAAASNDKFWGDKIDEVSVFGDVLTPTEIASLFTTVPYEIESPYLEDDLFGIQRIQSADLLYNFHGSYNVRKLNRFGHALWELEDIVFDWAPFMSENKTTTTITPSARTGTIELTASKSIFTADHVGSFWLIRHPRTADETVSPNKVTSTESDGFFDEAGEVSGSLKDVSGPWNFRTNGTWTGQLVVERSYDEGVNWHDVGGETFTSQDDQNFNKSGNETLGDAWLRIRAIEPDGTFAWIAAGATPDACVATLTAERFYHYGIVKITGYTSATSVTGTVTRNIGSTDATELWSEGQWSDERGYPSSGTFHEERLMLAGTINNPNILVGSKTDDWHNFRTGTLADDSVSYRLSSNEVNAIRWLISKEVLLMGTSGAEWKLGAFDSGEPLTPDNPTVPRVQTTYGSRDVQAIMLANIVLFVQQEGTVVRGAQFVFDKGESGAYDAFDYTTLAEHITKSGIVSMAYQQNPSPVLWCVLGNGFLIGMTFEPGEKVWGWFRVVTDGLFEDVAIIPGVSEDEIWCIVNRTINGATKRYIEYFTPRDWGDDIADMFFVDSGLSFDGGDAVTITGITNADPCVVTATNTFSDGDQIRIAGVGGMTDLNGRVYTVSNPTTSNWELRDKLDEVDIDSTGFGAYTSDGTAQQVDNIFAGLDHLEGKTVSVLGDGSVHDDVVVTSGHVTLTDYYNKVHIGLQYTSKLMPMKIVVPTNSGSSTGKKKKISQLTFSFKDTVGCEFGTTDKTDVIDKVPFRKVTDTPGEAVPLFTGEKQQTFTGGYELSGDIFIKQEQPLPLTLRSITVELGIFG